MADKFRVDIDEAIKSKNKKLYKMLPQFVRSYIKRIAHQDELNYILNEYGDFKGKDFANKILSYLNVSYTVTGKMPEGGRYMFASNHPLGGLDGIVLIDLLGKHYGNNIKFVVNDLLTLLEPFNNVFVAVNKHGRQTAESLQEMEGIYASNEQILNFPAGFCSRKIKGKITDTQWKKTFLTKAVAHKRDIVPIYFEGENSKFFHRLSVIRRFLGIKANVEMFYLSDEVFKKKGAHFNIYIGKPIPYTEINFKKERHSFWVNTIREKVYSLSKE